MYIHARAVQGCKFISGSVKIPRKLHYISTQLPVCHRVYFALFATVSNLTLFRYLWMPPLSNQGVRFLHWLTSKTLRCRHPSTTDSTPVPVTRTQPRTDSCLRANRCKPMLRSEGSETAEPQKDKFKCVRPGHPRARTSVAVSDRAQQKDYKRQSGLPKDSDLLTKSNSCNPFAALVK